MKRQKNTTQMMEQTRNTQVQINEEEIGKLPEKDSEWWWEKWSEALQTKCKKNAKIN